MGWVEIGAGYWELPDLSGGYNARPIVKIGDHQASASRNWFYWNGSLRNLYGASFYNSTTVNDANVAVSGVFQYKKRDGSSYIVATAGNTIKYLNSGVWIDITGSLTITAGHKFDFCTIDDTLIATNGVDAVISWTGSGDATALAGSPPIAKYCMPYGNYLLLANTTNYPDRIYRSNYQNISVWTVTDWWQFDTEHGSEITGMKKMGHRGVVYHEDTMSFFSGKTSSTFAIDNDALPGVGAVNGQSIVAGMFPFQATDENGEPTGQTTYIYSHLFRGYEGFYIFNGGMPQLISDHITKDNDNINRPRLDKCVMAYYPNMRQVWSFLSYGSSLTNDYGYIIDLVHGGFWPHSGFNAECATTIKESGVYKVLVGGSDGFIRWLDPSTFEITGSAMENYWYSKWFSITKPADMKMLRDMLFYVDMIGNYNLHVTLEYDLPYQGRSQSGTVSLMPSGATYSGIYGTSTYAGAGIDFRDGNIGGEGFTHIRIKLWMEDPASCKIEKIGAYLTSLGERRVS